MGTRQHLQPLDTSREAIAASRKRFEDVRIETMNGDSYRPGRQYEADPVMVDENCDPVVDRIFNALSKVPKVIDLVEVEDPTLKVLIKAETRGEVDNPFAGTLRGVDGARSGATLTLERAPIFEPQALQEVKQEVEKVVVVDNEPTPTIEEQLLEARAQLQAASAPQYQAEPVEKRSKWREKLSGGWKKARTAVVLGGAALVGVAAFNAVQPSEQAPVEEAAPVPSVELSAQTVTALKSQEFADLVQCSIDFGQDCPEVIEFAVQVDRQRNTAQ